MDLNEKALELAKKVDEKIKRGEKIGLLEGIPFGLKDVFLLQGAPAAAKPWDGAEGLEWEVPSPAPFHTFETPPKLNANATKIVA